MFVSNPEPCILRKKVLGAWQAVRGVRENLLSWLDRLAPQQDDEPWQADFRGRRNRSFRADKHQLRPVESAGLWGHLSNQGPEVSCIQKGPEFVGREKPRLQRSYSLCFVGGVSAVLAYSCLCLFFLFWIFTPKGIRPRFYLLFSQRASRETFYNGIFNFEWLFFILSFSSQINSFFKCNFWIKINYTQKNLLNLYEYCILYT